MREASPAAISRTSERSGGGKRALYFFSAARKGVQSASTCSGLFRVDFQWLRRAFLYAALVGSCMSPESVAAVAVADIVDGPVEWKKADARDATATGQTRANTGIETQVAALMRHRSLHTYTQTEILHDGRPGRQHWQHSFEPRCPYGSRAPRLPSSCAPVADTHTSSSPFAHTPSRHTNHGFP